MMDEGGGGCWAGGRGTPGRLGPCAMMVGSETKVQPASDIHSRPGTDVTFENAGEGIPGKRMQRRGGVARAPQDPSSSSESGSAPSMCVHVGLGKFRGSARVRVSSRAAGPASKKTSSAAASSVPPLFHFCYDQRSALTRLSQLSGEKAAPSSVPGREGHRSEGCGEHGAPPSSPRETFGRAARRPRSPGPDSCSREQRKFGTGESSSILTCPPALVCLIAPRSLRAQPTHLIPGIDPCWPIEPWRERRAEEEGVGLGPLGHGAVRSQLEPPEPARVGTTPPFFALRSCQ